MTFAGSYLPAPTPSDPVDGEHGGDVKGCRRFNAERKTLQPIIRARVKEGSKVSSDELVSHKDLSS